jgi:hypothetical protein
MSAVGPPTGRPEVVQPPSAVISQSKSGTSLTGPASFVNIATDHHGKNSSNV